MVAWNGKNVNINSPIAKYFLFLSWNVFCTRRHCMFQLREKRKSVPIDQPTGTDFLLFNYRVTIFRYSSLFPLITSPTYAVFIISQLILNFNLGKKDGIKKMHVHREHAGRVLEKLRIVYKNLNLTTKSGENVWLNILSSLNSSF